MTKRFVLFTIFEECFLIGAMLWGYSRPYTEAQPATVAALVSLLCLAVAIVNSALYFLARRTPWGSLRPVRKICRVIGAATIAFVVFFLILGVAGLFVPSSMGTIVELSAMAAVGFGGLGLVGVGLARESFIGFLRHPSEMNDGSSEDEAGSLQAAIVNAEGAADRAWLRQPHALRRMIASLQCGDGKYTLDEVVAYLHKSFAKIDSTDSRMALDFARWVDALFADVLIEDIGMRLSDWRASSQELSKLLAETESLLSSVFKDGGAGSSMSAPSGVEELGNVALCQRMRAYGCVAASIAGDESGFQEKMLGSISDVEGNIEFILGQDNPSCLAMLESAVGWGSYDPHARCWTAPVAILAHAAIPIGREEEAIRLCGRYVRFLKDAARSTNVLGGMLMDAQLTLAFLQGDAIGRDCPDLPICI